MQISTQEVSRARKAIAASRTITPRTPIRTVEELAARHGVDTGEMRRFTEQALMAEEDPARERRVRELAAKVARGTYRIQTEELLDMAERRAIADRSVEP